jgi:ABC-type transport system involved in multi-copper enzyme maturation permease subunit
VNATLIGALVRQRLASRIRMTLLVLIVGFWLLNVVFGGPHALSGSDDSIPLALVLAAGLIGQDFASGTLQLLLARPVTRPGYVLSRWCGATLAGCALLALQMALATLLMASRNTPPEPHDVVVFLGNGALTVAGMTAVVTLASSVATGLGDLALLLAALVGSLVISGIGNLRSWTWAVRAGDAIQHFLAPRLDVEPLLLGHAAWFDVTSYVSTVTVCLVLAMLAVNRRELSYASTGA